MKYLILLFLLVLILGCEDRPNPPLPVYIPNVSLNHECNDLIWMGFKIDGLACAKHIDHPKYKIGEFKKLRNNGEYSSKCRVQISKPVWTHFTIMNKPAYYGTVYCPNPQGKLVEFSSSSHIVLESELK